MNSRVQDHRTGRTSWITDERLGLGSPTPWLLFFFVVAAAGFTSILYILGWGRAETAFEAAYDTPLGTLLHWLPVGVGRAATASAAGIGIVLWGASARRLYHSNGIAIAATLLLALDTSLLVQGQYNQPLPWILLFSGLALVLALHPNPHVHWGIPFALAALGLETALAIPFGIALFLMLLARGHIYASNQHAKLAVLQTAPAWLGFLSTASYPVLSANAGYLGDTVQIHNPALWYVGIIAAVAGIIMVAVNIGYNFRMARHPGRVQFRMQNALPRVQGRILWTAALLPIALPAFILHILGGITALTEGNRTFRVALVIGVFAFSIIYLVRFWAFVAGNPTADDIAALQELLPWIQLAPS